MNKYIILILKLVGISDFLFELSPLSF